MKNIMIQINENFLISISAMFRLISRHKLPKNINDMHNGIATGTFILR